jgi:hypothetical protein
MTRHHARFCSFTTGGWLLVVWLLVLSAFSVPARSPSVQAQVEVQNVAYEGISFSYDTSLASNVVAETVPAQNNPDIPIAPNHPEYIQFTLDGYPVDGFEQPTIAVYPAQAYAANEVVGKSITETISHLQTILTSRINLRDAQLPFIPPVNAGRMFVAQPTYVDFLSGAGVRYLTEFTQNTVPISSDYLLYTFQGLTEDGQHYISARFPLFVPLPETTLLEDPYDETYYDKLKDYNDAAVAHIQQTSNADFTPDLQLLDALIQSLQIGTLMTEEQPDTSGIVELTGEVAYINDGNIHLLNLATGATSQVTNDGTIGEPAAGIYGHTQIDWSPDGEWIVFASRQTGNSDIYRIRPDGSDREQLTSTALDETLPAYTPAGNLVYVRVVDPWDGGAAAEGEHEIIVQTDDGQETVIHTEPCEPLSVSLRSDTQLAVSFGCHMTVATMALVDTTSGEPDIPFVFPGECYASIGRVYAAESPRWNSAGDQVAFVGADCPAEQENGDWTFGLFRVAMVQNEWVSTQILAGQNVGQTLDWSPDSAWIVYGYAGNEYAQSAGIAVISAQGGTPAHVLPHGHSPAWRPVIAAEPTTPRESEPPVVEPDEPESKPGTSFETPSQDSLVLEDVSIEVKMGQEVKPGRDCDKFVYEDHLTISGLSQKLFWLNFVNYGSTKNSLPEHYDIQVTLSTPQRELLSKTFSRKELNYPDVTIMPGNCEGLLYLTIDLPAENHEQVNLEILFQPEPDSDMQPSRVTKTMTLQDMPGTSGSFGQCVLNTTWLLGNRFIPAGDNNLEMMTASISTVAACPDADTGCVARTAATEFLKYLVGNLFTAIIDSVEILTQQEEQYKQLEHAGCYNVSAWLHSLITGRNSNGDTINSVLTESPVYPLVTNEHGQRTGFLEDGEIVEEIPGSRAATIGERRLILYEGTDFVEIDVTGYATGKMNIHTVLAQETASSIIFSHKNVDVTQGMRATLTSTDSSYTLNIDYDADGVVDASVQPDTREELIPERIPDQVPGNLPGDTAGDTAAHTLDNTEAPAEALSTIPATLPLVLIAGGLVSVLMIIVVLAQRRRHASNR